METVSILAGGSSSESDVSLKTANTLKKHLITAGYKPVVINPKSSDWLNRVPGTVVVLALHGSFGEDGQVQKILEENNISFTGSRHQASELAFDKKRAKQAVEKLDINTPVEFRAENVKLPVVVKPAREGSSFGVTIVSEESQLDRAISIAKKYDNQIVIEEYINGQEVSCGVTEYTGKPASLPVIEIIPKSQFFDFQSKYQEDGATEIVPARISKELTKNIQEKSERIFKAFGLRQYARIDWIIRDNQAYFLEVNTLPGMTETSLINKELAAAGISISNFVRYLVETANH